MSFEPTVTEQELLAESFRNRGARMTRRDVAVVTTLAVGFFAAVAAIWVAHPPVDFDFVPVALCVLTFALAMRVQFDTPIGFTVPTQLAFVPLLFATPIAIAPLAVLAAVTLARVPDILRAEDRARPPVPRDRELVVRDRPGGGVRDRGRRAEQARVPGAAARRPRGPVRRSTSSSPRCAIGVAREAEPRLRSCASRGCT